MSSNKHGALSETKLLGRAPLFFYYMPNVPGNFLAAALLAVMLALISADIHKKIDRLVSDSF